MDAGAGTGYLTHLVALQNPGAQVYAIDSDASRTVGSKDRAKRMLASSAHRYPPSILEGAVRSHAVPASPVQHSTGLVDVSTIRRCAGDRAILTGLHCCGDLGGRTMIEAFEQCESVKALCVVGCCYQRIYVGGDEAGFPLSSSIRTALDTSSCALNTRSLSTACFSFSSFPDRAAIRSSLHGHTNRALLEHLLAAHVPLRVGSVPAHAHVSFESYAHAAAKKLGLLTEELGQRITAMENMRRGSEGRIAFCVAVRSLMGSVVEALVIADRVARIREIPGVERVIARNLFDAALSPRNVVIIGEKAVGKKT
ncbi:hypothetical protein BDZ88DRAFT_36766 [Geranomyces variabilis]|nr:hypothetical protein BDZ88DRAFT_36766 [Geranomyces variabilis]